jgi:predicted porin
LVGVLKLPFSIHELDSTARYEFTSAGEANGMVSDLGFAGRDVGAEVMVTPLSKPRYLRLSAGVFRGHADDANASPIGAFGGRVETEPTKGLRLGGSVIRHPNTIVEKNALDTGGKNLLPDPDDVAYPRAETWEKGTAFSADATFNRFGLMLRAEGMMGDRVDYDTRYGANRWAAVWGIAAYRFDVGPVDLEPGFRAEWLDTDSENDGGLYRQLTLGLGTHLSKRTRILVDVTRMDVQDNSPVVDQPRPLRELPYNALSSTTLTGQLQIVL